MEVFCLRACDRVGGGEIWPWTLCLVGLLSKVKKMGERECDPIFFL